MSGWKIGINPIGWINDDLPSLGGRTPVETMLHEAATLGYDGVELGGKFPDHPLALRQLLREHDLACVSGWYSGRLAEGTVEAEIDRCQPHLEKLRLNGSTVVVYGEVAGSIQGQRHVPLQRRPQFRGDAQWRAYARRLDQFGAHLQAVYGIRLAYHHHAGAYVESPADIDRLMDLTNPEHVHLLFDSGHAALGAAAEPAELLRRHVQRVVHVHCKDVRWPVLRRMRNEGWSFLEGVLNGVFTVPGDGGLDFADLLGILHVASYSGWLVVEAEQDPAIAPPLPAATRALHVLRTLAAGAQEKADATP